MFRLSDLAHSRLFSRSRRLVSGTYSLSGRHLAVDSIEHPELSPGVDRVIDRRVFALSSLAGFMALALPQFARADHCRCARCQCANACKVCRLKCEEKTVEVVMWGMVEEPFCAPGCGCERCEHCEVISTDDGATKGVHSEPKSFFWSDWFPKASPTLHTRRKLMKRVVKKKVPTYRWVVEDLCKQCQTDAASEIKIAADAVVPPVPEESRGLPVVHATHLSPDVDASNMPVGN